ncbi:hypothetical protein [Paenibacillus foliorum]|nr:hypothetical protein [Paenibacillus foliorum]
MEVVLNTLKEEEIPVLKNLFEFVAYDLSELNKASVKEMGLYSAF